MKKNLYFVLFMCLFISLSGCNISTNNASVSDEKTEEIENDQYISDFSSIDELEETVYSDVDATIEQLNEKQEKLKSQINTYELYIKNFEKVESFYNESIEETNQLGIRLRDYSLKYAKLILNDHESYDDKYDELKGIYKCIYDDAGKDMYDIYDEILKDMYDIYYDGVLKDAYDTIPYEEWYDTHTDDYDLWYDSRSEVYDIWYDARSDIYDFYSDIRSEVYDQDEKRIEKKMNKFEEDILVLKKDQQ